MSLTRKQESIALGVSGALAVGVAVYFYSRNKTAPANAQSFPAGTPEYLLNPSGTATTEVSSPSVVNNTITSGPYGAGNYKTVIGPGGTNPHNAFIPLNNGNIMLYDQYGMPFELTYQQAKVLGYTGPA